jgi:hypothetical protein
MSWMIVLWERGITHPNPLVSSQPLFNPVQVFTHAHKIFLYQQDTSISERVINPQMCNKQVQRLVLEKFLSVPWEADRLREIPVVFIADRLLTAIVTPGIMKGKPLGKSIFMYEGILKSG